MARKPRVSVAGVAEHVIQRGNNRQSIFAHSSNMKAYVVWLKEYAEKYEVNIHSWVLMTNHVHLLCTPNVEFGTTHMMQALGRKYVQYFNRRYSRTGTLWEGRFRSSLVDNERYLMHLHRYIELNPVRAGMVTDPGEYTWSSYQINALGKISSLASPHPLYLQLGKSDVQRRESYRKLFEESLDSKLLTDIRNAANKGLALGSDVFIKDVEKITGKLVSKGKPGRPRLDR
jgi:putative transposase